MVDTGRSDDLFFGGRGPRGELFIGGAGATGAVTADLMTGKAMGAGHDLLRGIENLSGWDGPDTLLGNNRPNILEGGAGNDHLEGRGGNDDLNGSTGHDYLDGGAGAKDICHKGETVLNCEVM